MRIAVLASSYPRYPGDGTAPFVQSICEALSKRGHNIEVIVPFDVDVVPDHSSDVIVHRFKYIWPLKYHIMGHGRALESDVKLKPLTFFLLPIFILAEILKLLQVTQKQKSDLIHVHWVLPNGIAALIVSRIQKIPYILSLHGSDVFVSRKNPVFGFVAKNVIRNASFITACSPELLMGAKDLGAEDHVSLLAWGADPNIFTPDRRNDEFRHRKNWEKEKIIIFALGRMVYKKGFDILIKSWQKIKNECDNVQLIIGGDGPLRKLLQLQIDQQGITNIELPGKISWAEVPDYLANADIFVLPSVVDQKGNIDGLPTVLLEAMGSGLPVIASNIAGVPLVIRDKTNGILVKPGDENELATALSDLINNQAERQRIGKNARNDVENCFNWDEVARTFEAYYSNAKG